MAPMNVINSPDSVFPVHLLANKGTDRLQVVAYLGIAALHANSITIEVPVSCRVGFYYIRIGDSFSSMFMVGDSLVKPITEIVNRGVITISSASTIETSHSATKASQIAPLVISHTSTTPATEMTTTATASPNTTIHQASVAIVTVHSSKFTSAALVHAKKTSIKVNPASNIRRQTNATVTALTTIMVNIPTSTAISAIPTTSADEATASSLPSAFVNTKPIDAGLRIVTAEATLLAYDSNAATAAAAVLLTAALMF
ncbi:hypothetical protein BGZ54_002778 [Gamsiella multidivaricata]|nr:hypothetical protein BGZ54_002778 [Gamsiella multidivaricata]